MYPLEPALRASLEAVSDRFRFTFSPPDGQAAVDALEGVDIEVLLANYCPTRLERFPALRWLALAGAGVEHLAATDPWRRGITVTNGSGLHAGPMAEFVLSSFLRFSQGFARRERSAERRGWPTPWGKEWIELLGTPLRGKVVTVVGYGSIGREIARLAAAFGMRVIAVKARPDQRADAGYIPPGMGDPAGAIPERFAGPDELVGAFAVSDYVAIAIPWTPRTDRLVDRRAIDALPRGAVVVNIARGKVLDQEALVEALRAGRIGGAALDVLAPEPPSADDPIWTVPNLVLTPHVSGAYDPTGGWGALTALLRLNLERYAAGHPLVNVVDGGAGY